MLLRQGSPVPESGNSNGNLILKTVLISAGSCMLSLFLLLLVGLTLYRVHGGRTTFLRPRRALEVSLGF